MRVNVIMISSRKYPILGSLIYALMVIVAVMVLITDLGSFVILNDSYEKNNLNSK
jgi:hypothetical protein